MIADVDSKARIFQEEIFGPVLAVTKARDFEHAMELANDSEYGLTGAVYSNNPENIKKARAEFFVGNLYINRKCTGRDGGRASLWRIQYVGHRFEGGRAGLSAAIFTAEIDCGKGEVTTRVYLESQS